jgi:hypothetical protein
METAGAATPQAIPEATAETTGTPQAWAFGGWLLLVGFGIWLGPFRLVYNLWGTYQPLFSDGHIEDILHAASMSFILLLCAELLVNLVLFAISLYLIYLFMRKSRQLPKWYFILAASTAVFLLIDTLLISLMFPDLEVFTDDVIKLLVGCAISLSVWVPYLYISERAKNTFVH